MRKVIAIVLLALFGFSFAPPLVASVQMSSMMRACCHKAAKQHCAAMRSMDGMAMDDMAMDGMAMTSTDDTANDVSVSPRMACCGCCMFMMATAGHAALPFVVTDASVPFTPRSTRAGLAPQRTSLLDATWQQSGNKRGPPASSLRNA